MEDQPLVSIVIRTKNEAQYLGETLAAIRRQLYRRYEVIVIDSGSTDDTVAIARAAGVRVHEIPAHTFSYGGAINTGAAMAGGDLLVILSAHAVPADEHWLGRLVRACTVDGAAGAFSRQVPQPDCNPLEAEAVRQCYPAAGPNSRVTFSNSSSCVRRDAWVSFPFDETLAYSEDAEWAVRVRRAGRRVLYVPESCVIHSHNERFGQLLRRSRNEGKAEAALGLAVRRGTWLGVCRIILEETLKDWVRGVRERWSVSDLLYVLTYRTARHIGTFQGRMAFWKG